MKRIFFFFKYASDPDIFCHLSKAECCGKFVIDKCNFIHLDSNLLS